MKNNKVPIKIEGRLILRVLIRILRSTAHYFELILKGEGHKID